MKPAPPVIRCTATSMSCCVKLPARRSDLSHQLMCPTHCCLCRTHSAYSSLLAFSGGCVQHILPPTNDGSPTPVPAEAKRSMPQTEMSVVDSWMALYNGLIHRQPVHSNPQGLKDTSLQLQELLQELQFEVNVLSSSSPGAQDILIAIRTPTDSRAPWVGLTAHYDVEEARPHCLGCVLLELRFGFRRGEDGPRHHFKHVI